MSNMGYEQYHRSVNFLIKKGDIRMKKYLTTVLLLLAVPVYGQVVLDGTMGTAGLVKGPAYDIKAEYGQKAGTNLFHSFGQFDIGTAEIASFGVSADIQNIISRVTGGTSSKIDGTLRSVISGTSNISDANLYLLNPAGILFGPNAALDIGGSFHVSTADYLRMGEEERFYAVQESEVLSAAAPDAFGFLDDVIEKIRFEGDIAEEFSGGLTVSEGKTISVIGGAIEITGISYQYPENNVPPANLHAPGGEIHLASLASAGEALLTASGPDVSSFGKLGKISLSENSLIKTSGEGSGNIFIRGGEFFAADSSIEADTLGDQDGGITDIQVNTLTLNHSNIFSDTEGKAKGGSINILAAESVNLSDSSRIFADATGKGSETGSAGNVSVEAKQISLSSASAVSGETYGKSRGGNVLLRAEESVDISGASQVFSRSTGEQTLENAGAAGKISIESKTVSLSDESKISTDTYSDGQGGSISISGNNDFAESLTVFNSSIYGGATGTGSGGTVYIKAKDISFTEGEIGSQTFDKGDAGDIQIEAEQIELKSGSLISSASTLPDQGGDAGTVHITVNKSMNLSGGSAITTEAEDAGKGQISVVVGDRFYLTDSRITTSIKGGGEDAGDIYTAQDVAVLRKSQVVANAYEGKGGNIRIVANPFVQSTMSLVDASSRFGIDGTVYIESPDDVSSSLMTLPGSFLDAARWMRTPCFARSGEDASRFLLLGKDAVPSALNDWLPSPLLWKGGKDGN
jgi:filamentous hemagglutinin family protein